jgi:hypothetical protein
MRRLFFSALSLLAPACCEVKGPCIPWAKVGETYQVELVQRLVNAHPGDPNSLDPFAGYRSADYTCGRGLDLDVGFVIQMRAARSRDVGETCSCSDLEARASVSMIQWTERGSVGQWVGTPEFLDQGHVVIGDSCKGVYSIGVSPVSSAFIQRSDEWIATDYVLFRTLSIPGDIESCLVQGSALSAAPANHSCWDAWAVRVKDSAGHVLTRDIARTAAKVYPKDADSAIDAGL